MPTDPSHSASAHVEAGSLVGLWRYPVKSMMGEELNAAEVTERGLDRRCTSDSAAFTTLPPLWLISSTGSWSTTD
jgi:hypothetical protein